MRVRMRLTVQGTFQGNPNGANRGDIVDIADEHVDRYLRLGYCESKLTGELGPGYQSAS